MVSPGIRRKKGKFSIADAAFIILFLTIITLMVVPVPVFLTDVFIFTSISLSIVILMMTLYVDKATSFSSFPVILLTLAVYRIALSVATTRNILVHGESGDIIQAFGEVAISGNVLVGFVIFLIITIVQFVVINKGAERVAEVGARFTLDAMPGKQMSIDADLRSGALDFKAASNKRSEVQQESEFNGAMDGSMKFLKGDAIAGVLIIVVNFIGGLIVGAGQNGMPIGTALETYSILTIGDGLVAQIPSIFTAIASGVLVTRISQADQKGADLPSLAGLIAYQIKQYPLALLASAFVISGVALFPGFPTLLVVSFALLMIAGWWFISREESGNIETEKLSLLSPASEVHNAIPGRSLTLAIAKNNTLKEANASLLAETEKIIHELRETWNVPVPNIDIQFTDDLEDDQYLFLEDGEAILGGTCRGQSIMSRNIAWAIDVAEIEAECFHHYGEETSIFALSESASNKVKALGATCFLPAEYIALRLKEKLTQRLNNYFTLEYSEHLYDQFSEIDEKTALELINNLSNIKLFTILQDCIQDGIPLKAYSKLYRLIYEYSMRTQDTSEISARVRRGMITEIASLYLSNDGFIYYCDVNGRDAAVLEQLIKVTPYGPVFEMPPATCDHIFATIKQLQHDWKFKEFPIVIIVPSQIRLPLRNLLRPNNILQPILGRADFGMSLRLKKLKTLKLLPIFDDAEAAAKIEDQSEESKDE